MCRKFIANRDGVFRDYCRPGRQEYSYDLFNIGNNHLFLKNESREVLVYDSSAEETRQ
ncbi:hypothetical protein ACFLQP_02635 [Acidobacteriota bacterium]